MGGLLYLPGIDNSIVMCNAQHPVCQGNSFLKMQQLPTKSCALVQPLSQKKLGSKVVNFDRTTWDCVKGTILTKDQICGWDRNDKFPKVHHRKVTCRSWLIEVICNWYFTEPQEYLRYKQVVSKL